MVIYNRRHWVVKDNLLRSNFELVEIRKLILKSFLSSSYYSVNNKIYFASHFLLFSSISSISRYRNACLFSSYGRVVFHHFRLSRHFCKRFASHGYLLGLRKASF